MMSKIRALLWWLWVAFITPIFTALALLVLAAPQKIRYRVITAWSWLVIWGLRLMVGVRWQVHGIENLPATPCVIASRHESAWETFAFQLIFPPQAFILKRELLWIPFFGWGLACLPRIAINRNQPKLAAKQLLEQGKQRLQEGFFVIVFPEGTRLAPFEQRKLLSGAARLAVDAQCPIVPVVHNAGSAWPKKGFWFQSKQIDVYIEPALAATSRLKTSEQTVKEASLVAESLNQQLQSVLHSRYHAYFAPSASSASFTKAASPQ